LEADAFLNWRRHHYCVDGLKVFTTKVIRHSYIHPRLNSRRFDIKERTVSNWAWDLLHSVERASDPSALFDVIDSAAKSLGFEHCAIGMRLAAPVSRPRTFMMSSQPHAWQSRYVAAGYLKSDPTVRNGSLSEAPQIWSDELFRETQDLWHEAQGAGLRHGWAQSSLDAVGLGSMITLSRSADPITAAEVKDKLLRIQQLGHMAHLAFQQRLIGREAQMIDLTDREKDVLRWAADGATSAETAKALRVKADTVNFHVKNATAKLGTSGKTATVARALLMRLLD
jgi:LuxR family transcriptional regulator